MKVCSVVSRVLFHSDLFIVIYMFHPCWFPLDNKSFSFLLCYYSGLDSTSWDYSRSPELQVYI